MNVYGADTFIALVDSPGVQSNSTGDETDFSRLLVNTLNEAMSWITHKIVFEKEDLEARKEKLKVFYPQLHDNTPLLREIISKTGLLSSLTKMSHDMIVNDDGQNELDLTNFKHLTRIEGNIQMKHFWGVETYEEKQFLRCNECFVNPDLVTVLSSSADESLKSMFTSHVSEEGKMMINNMDRGELETRKLHQLTSSQQTVAAKFQHLLSSVVRLILTCEPHFVFCFDSGKDLDSQVELFNIKELNFVRRNGYSHRLDFADFLQRYCFLAFNFDERVVASRKDAQLLMIRLGIDGFYCGKKKIFLKYYHVDFLSKFYDEQYKRIVTVQAAARRYLAKIKAEREKCSKLAKTMFHPKRILKKWRQYKRAEVSSSLTSGSGNKFNTLQKNKAATEIQRHVRGHNVRKHLSKELRFKLLNILLSPHPQRKTLAENILKNEAGVDNNEAKNIVEDLEEAVMKKEQMISKQEALSLLPSIIYQHNISVSDILKSTRGVQNLESVQKLPLPYIHLEPDVVKPGGSVIPSYVLPSTVYDILNFYTDLGPSKDLETIVKEKIKYEVKNPHTAVHVIKERDSENCEKYENLSIRTTTGRFRKNSLTPLVSRIPKNKVGDSKKFFQNKINQLTPRQNGKCFSKWPEVKAPYNMKDPKSNPSAGVIQQLNNLKNVEQEFHDEAPFDFKCLLRKSNVLPTETLRRRRHEPRDHVANVVNGNIQNLSSAIDL